ncbi:nicotinate-nucleotide adenylyltransferase [Stenotrophomonas mori]|uniref:Probable nicotinate-nucleotide adenylyltransferase n=1 Tax=Stenotrophomonas mori TaxID=2871096 RepID=A0ABT0SET1_9GAMM|nr:nicotinate-nucleotide adenylyltransferase [Stenotrophomonas mori]MCL7713525.1 nicotinate-nucleotide adenylyltransferase [Stenotrophomonas mori]
MRLIYGGTFDPVHDGHLAIARCARDALQVPVWLMPAADPPHRPPPGADAAQRTRMLELALEGEPGLAIDRRELRRAAVHPGVPSWTVETLRELRGECGGEAPLALLMGADSLRGLTGWHAWEQVLALAHIVVAERPGSGLDTAMPAVLADALRTAWSDSSAALLAQPAGRVWRLRQPLHEGSATAVRQSIASGGPWRGLLPAAVADYIQAHGLYGAGREA